MKKKISKIYILVLALLITTLLVACGENTSTVAPAATIAPTKVAPATNPPAIANPTAAPVVTTPASVPDAVKPAFEVAIKDLQTRVNGLQLADISLLRYEQKEYPNSALGCPAPDAMYQQVITPGWQLTVNARGQTYDYRTNLEGRRAVLCSSNGTPIALPTP